MGLLGKSKKEKAREREEKAREKKAREKKAREEKALHVAGNGDLATLRTLVTQQRGVVHALDWYEDTPLHEASRKGHLAVAQFLVQQGARVEAVNKVGSSPLHSASSNGHLAVAQFLVQQGARVEAVNKDGWTPLHWASNGHLAVVQFLVQQGARVEAVAKNGWTPLYRAVRDGHRAVAEYLVRAGASLDVTPTDGDPPLRELMAQKGMADALQRAAQERNPPQAAPQPPQPRAAPQAATPHADELRAAAAEASRLRAEVEAANTQLRAAEQKAQAAQRTADSEAEKRRAAEKGMEAAQRTAEEATAQLRAAEKKADAMAKAMEAAQRTAEETSAQLRASEAEASRLRHTVAEMEAQLRAAEENAQAAQHAAGSEAEKRHQAAHRAVAEMEAQLRAANEELDRMRADHEARTAALAADNDVAHWLHERDLGEYAGTFADAKIRNLSMMTIVDKEDAPELISSVFHRKFFLAELEKLKAALKGGTKLDTIEAKYTPTDEPPFPGRNTVQCAVSNATGTPVVIKVFASDEALQRELMMLQLLGEAASRRVPHVLCVDVAARTIVMVRGQFSLREYIAAHRPPKGGMASGVVFQLLEALAAVHGAGYVHGDVKPGNYVRVKEEWAIIDFGGARAIGSTGGAELEYTHTHVAPEVARALRTNSDLRLSAAQDVWALGLTIVYVLCGHELFAWDEGEALSKAAALTQDAVDRALATAAVPISGARKLLARMLRIDPAERASAVELLAEPFVSGNVVTSSAVRRKLEELQRAVESGLEDIGDAVADVHVDVKIGKGAAEDAAARAMQ